MKQPYSTPHLRRTYISLSGALLAIAFLFVLVLPAAAAIPISSQLDFGDQGTDVRDLQTFLASDPDIYPEGLITGYYGTLTQRAVQRFQSKHGIVSSGSPFTTGYGRVGPSTLSKVNQLITSGGASNSQDKSGPALSSKTESVTSNSVTFNWNTNEPTTAKVFYNTSPVTMNEGDINSVGFGSTNGWIATNNQPAGTSHQVTINGLQPNTTYYYVLVATDLAGNVSVWNPNLTFKTQ